MDHILVILLAIAVVKLVIIAILLCAVFRSDIRDYVAEKRGKSQPAEPVCVYCQSHWTNVCGEPQTRWEDGALVLVTTYECQHCHLPFWHVERLAIESAKRS